LPRSISAEDHRMNSTLTTQASADPIARSFTHHIDYS
jgi:hypothetical protein